MMLGGAPAGYARDLNAGFVLDEMSEDMRFGYISGIVEGLAYSRYLRDKPDESGMKCIDSWFYGSGNEKWSKIEQWFDRHREKPPGVLMHVLIKKECGA